jgi:hypothetical protein
MPCRCSFSDRLVIILPTIGSPHPPTSLEQHLSPSTAHPETQLARRTGYHLVILGRLLWEELSPDRQWTSGWDRQGLEDQSGRRRWIGRECFVERFGHGRVGFGGSDYRKGRGEPRGAA